MYNSNSMEDVHLLVPPESQDTEGGADGQQQRKLVRRARAKTAPSRTVQHVPDTSAFLKKNQRVRTVPNIDRKVYQCVLDVRRPPIPKPLPPTQPTLKNFVRKNVEMATHLQAKPHAPIVVVSCRGDRRDLTRILEARQLRESDNFGKLPKYLTVRQKRWEEELTKREEEMDRRRRDEENPMRGYRQVPEEERQSLLKGLKDRWNEVHKEFLRLPVQCDTPSKVKRKLQLESKLVALEKNIELLERNPYIFLDPSKKSF